jgi:hypothetical protein
MEDAVALLCARLLGVSDRSWPIDHVAAGSNGAGVQAVIEPDFCADCARGCPSRGSCRMLPDVVLAPCVRGAPKAATVMSLRCALVTSALVTRAAKPVVTKATGRTLGLRRDYVFGIELANYDFSRRHCGQSGNQALEDPANSATIIDRGSFFNLAVH